MKTTVRYHDTPISDKTPYTNRPATPCAARVLCPAYLSSQTLPPSGYSTLNFKITLTPTKSQPRQALPHFQRENLVAFDHYLVAIQKRLLPLKIRKTSKDERILPGFKIINGLIIFFFLSHCIFKTFTVTLLKVSE